MITDPVEIGTKFCKYFTNIGPNLAKAIPDVNSTFRSFLDDDSHPPWNLPTPENWIASVRMLASSRAQGWELLLPSGWDARSNVVCPFCTRL